MPESEKINHDIDPDEQIKLQKLFDERQANVPRQMDKLFEKARKEQKSPAEIILSDPLDEAVQIFGQERIGQFINGIKAVDTTDKSKFIEQMANLLTPLNYDRFFDPAIKEKADALERMSKGYFESIRVGTLEAKIHPAEWHIKLSDETEVKTGDAVLEISWPTEGDKPHGLNDIKQSFQEIAKLLQNRPEIKAVVGVSWMMSRNATTKLGFEKFPNISIDAGSKSSILDMANTARHDKEYKKGVKEEDVMLGAMSRRQFIDKYKV